MSVSGAGPAPPARLGELLMALGAAGLRLDLVTVDADMVTVRSPHGSDSTVTPEVDTSGPFWEVRQYDSDGNLDRSAQLHDSAGVVAFLNGAPGLRK